MSVNFQEKKKTKNLKTNVLKICGSDTEYTQFPE